MPPFFYMIKDTKSGQNTSMIYTYERNMVNTHGRKQVQFRQY